jgi:glutamate synthase (NADPH/NADH) small chain
MHEKGQKPIEIGRLQRHAVDYVLDRKIQLFHAGASNGKRVACIGGGPASLACAAELAQTGYRVTIFDRNAAPGGLNTYGIAAYKLRADDSLREVEPIRRLGVEFQQNVEIGQSLPFARLENDYDAIFIGVGLGETWDLALPGENLVGVCGAMEFIEATKLRSFAEVQVGRRIACVGAGNTAIDVVTAAKRLGSDSVHLIYRRGDKEMPAFRYEYDLAKLDGVLFHWYTQPIRILGEEGKVTGIECIRTRLEQGNGRESGRVVPILGSEFKIDVDMVVRAIGQKPVTDLFRTIPGIEVRDNGTIAINEKHYTGAQKYFAGGDCTNGGKEVVDAVAEGKAAARSIDAWLGTPSARN